MLKVRLFETEVIGSQLVRLGGGGSRQGRELGFLAAGSHQTTSGPYKERGKSARS